MSRVPVWPNNFVNSSVTLASGYVITAAGALASDTKEIRDLLGAQRLLDYDPSGVNPNPSPIPPVNLGGGGLVFDSVAQMLLYPAVTNDQSAKLLGYHSPNDGGGGDFWFAFGATDTIDNGLVFGSGLGLGRWKRVLEPGLLYRNVKWFGAYGDGDVGNGGAGHDDTDAIRQMFKSMSVFAWGAEFFFPAGYYNISSTIKLEYGGTTNPWSNFYITGENSTGAGFKGTTLQWVGPSTNPSGFFTAADSSVDRPLVQDSVMLQIGVPGVLVRHMCLAPRAGSTCGTLVNIGHDQGVSPAYAVSNVKFQWCTFNGGPDNASGTCNQNVVFDLWENANDQNLENCGFQDCNFGGALHSCVWYRQTTQPFSNYFHNCSFFNPNMMQGKTLKTGYTFTGQEPYGIGIRNDSIATSLEIIGGENQRVACMYYFRANPASFKCINGAAEAWKKILYQAWSNGNDLNTVSIDAGRWSPDGLQLPSYGWYTNWDKSGGDWDSSSTNLIVYSGDATLNLTNNAFGGTYATEPTNVLVYSSDINSFGNHYGNMQPFKRAAVWNGAQGRTVSKGDTAYDSSAGRNNKLPELRGAENPGRVDTVSGTATFVDYVFAVPECTTPAGGGSAVVPDYKVHHAIQGVTGTPAGLSVYVSNQSASGYRLNLSSAPGAGNSVTIAHYPYRN